MNTAAANIIIQEYQSSLAKGTLGETVLRKASWLPHSIGVIKYAYFIVIEDAIGRSGGISDDLRNKYIADYSILSSFIDDNTAIKYAENYRDWQAKKASPLRTKTDERFIKQYIAYTHLLQIEGLPEEINEFIRELTEKNNISQKT